MLYLSGFEKKYGDTLIIKIDELKLPQGIYWFKGHNGSGKSTLFKSIAGLIPFSGTIAFNNIDLKSKPVAFRKIANYSEAEPLYPPFITAKDLIHFVGKAKSASAENLRQVTDYFGINSFINKPCETFSSGMLKKLSLALAFLGQPKLIILDEPLITLDEETKLKLLQMIKTKSSEGVTFLLSSHQALDGDIELSCVYEIKNQSLHIV